MEEDQHPNFTRRQVLATVSKLPLLLLAGMVGFRAQTALAATYTNRQWQDIIAQASGQDVRFHAWGGDPKINAYIDWVGKQVKEKYNIQLQQMKLADTGEAVRTIAAEKVANNNTAGSVDLIWINGENFRFLKQQNLLYGPFAESLPNFRYVDVVGKPSVVNDFGLATDGLEVPWGMAVFVMMANTKFITTLPRNPNELLQIIKQRPGRFTYPLPPDFTGSTFLKQLMLSLNDASDPRFTRSPTDQDLQVLSAPVWQWLDEAHPHCWQQARRFPNNYSMLRDLLNNLEVDFAMAFNPNEAAVSINQQLLPDSIRPFIFESGMIGNTHFVAIPYNSGSTAAGQVVANFLIEPEVQARKSDINIWGDPTVLDVAALSPQQRQMFNETNHPAQLPAEKLGPILTEPHADWMGKLQQEWIKRYGEI